VADGTTFRGCRLLILKQRVYERRATVGIQSDNIKVLIVRKADAEFGNGVSSLKAWIGNVAQTWEKPARRISRRHGNMAVRTDRRRRPFACKELLAMTIQARRVLGEIGYVRKGRITLTNIFPIFRRNFVARIAGEFLRNGVGGVREFCVIDFGFRGDFPLLGAGSRLRAFLRSRPGSQTSTCDDK